jgi:FkbM family methyltransferase
MRGRMQAFGWRTTERVLGKAHATLSFSQEGEDLILARLLAGAPPSRFVDVGAHHPTRFSNTYLLYLRGWTGINVDPTPGSMKRFRRQRPNDTNLEIAISGSSGRRSFFMFDEPALNTFDEDVAIDRVDHGYVIVRTVEVETEPLSAVLACHLVDESEVGFLTIDTEGHDFEVLGSVDWSVFRPRIVCVESSSTSGRTGPDPSIRFLERHGYSMAARTANSNVLLRG